MNGVPRGWELIALPFKPNSFNCDEAGKISKLIPFPGNNQVDWANNRYCCVKEFRANTDSSEKDVESLEANKAYLIRMPNTPYYNPIYNVNAPVTFIAKNALIEATATPVSSGNKTIDNIEYNIYHSYDHIQRAENTYYLDEKGSYFEKGINDITPFRGYLEIPTEKMKNAPSRISVDYKVSTSIMQPIMNKQNTKDLFIIANNGTIKIIAEKNQIINIYAIDGRMILSKEIFAGENFIYELNNGVYIIEGIRVIL